MQSCSFFVHERHSPEKSDRSLFLTWSELRWNKFQSMNIKLFPEDTFIFDYVKRLSLFICLQKKKKLNIALKKLLWMLKEFYHCYYSISFVWNVMLDRIWAVTKFAVGSVGTPTSTWQSLLCLNQGEVRAAWTEKM